MFGFSQRSLSFFLMTLMILIEIGSTFNHGNRDSEQDQKSITDPAAFSEDSIESLDDIKPEKSVAKAIGKVIGFVVTATIVVIVITIVCCCCCPFCILAKRKERGRVLRQGPPTQQQPQNPGVGTQQGYALPTEQYQQQMAPQPYPNAGYNQQMPPSAVPYGNQGPSPQGFVMDQPPPYPGPPIQQNQMQQSSVGGGYGSEYQKQPAFNPNAS